MTNNQAVELIKEGVKAVVPQQWMDLGDQMLLHQADVSHPAV